MESSDLKKAGLKATLPRLKILEILEQKSDLHMRAEDVYKSLLESGDDVGLATVYRVLTQFEAAGLVTRHHFEGGHAVFELNEGKHHDHIVCVSCGKVDEFIDEVIEVRQRAIAKKFGYAMTDHALNIYGKCTDCQVKEKTAKK
ncbi:MAG: ferric iron uptake transcriptional regulator [Pseudomonadota bacterium]